MDWYPLFNSLRIAAMPHCANAQWGPRFDVSGQAEPARTKGLPQANRLYAACSAVRLWRVPWSWRF